METITLDVGGRPRVRVPSVGGDLRIVGRAGSSLEAQAPSRTDLTVTREGDLVVVTSRLGCLLFLPEGTEVEIGAVGGDARLSGITGRVSLATVSGDLNLRSMGAVHLGKGAGDVRIVQASGLVTAEWIGGDARLDTLQAGMDVGQVEGSLLMRRVSGAAHAHVLGDLDAELAPPPASESRLHAEGDLICRLSPEASVVIHYRAQGEARVALPSHVPTEPRAGTAQVGAGEARLELESQGDLRVGLSGSPARWDEEWKQDLEARIEAEVDAALAGLEGRQGLGGLSGLMREEIAERIRSSMGKARRHAARAAQVAEAGAPREVRIHLGESSATETPVGDEERLEILRMVERGSLTVEQAEQLFRAMEGGA